MDKYIESDLHNGLVYLRCAIMNMIDVLVSNEECKEISYEKYIPFSLVRECFEDLGYEVIRDFETNGWDCDCWIYYKKNNKEIVVQGNLYYGTLKMWINNGV